MNGPLAAATHLTGGILIRNFNGPLRLAIAAIENLCRIGDVTKEQFTLEKDFQDIVFCFQAILFLLDSGQQQLPCLQHVLQGQRFSF